MHILTPMFITDLHALAAITSETEGVRSTLTMFLVLAGLLGAFFLAVIVLSVLRHRHERRSKATSRKQATVDPWVEAGKRIRPYRNR